MREIKSLLHLPTTMEERIRRIHTVAQVVDDVVDTVALVVS